MKNKYSKHILSACVIACSIAVKAQDVHFSQYNETPVIINPALSCTAYDTRVIANYKNQWASITSPFTTYGISIEQALKHLKLRKSYMGLSLVVLNDKAGDGNLGTLTANLGVNAVVKTGKFSKLSTGIGGGINYRTINPGGLKWESQYDGYKYNGDTPSMETIPNTSMIQADFTGGMVFHYAKSERYISAQDGTKADIGFAAFHYNSPKYSFTGYGGKTSPKFVGHANFDIGIKGAGIALVPSVIYMRQGSAQEINAGFMLKYIIQDQAVYTGLKKACAISGGIYYRVGDAMIPTLLFQYDKYALGVSYDLNVSQLTAASRAKGGVEVCLRFNTSPGYGKALGGSFNRPTK